MFSSSQRAAELTNSKHTPSLMLPEKMAEQTAAKRAFTHVTPTLQWKRSLWYTVTPLNVAPGMWFVCVLCAKNTYFEGLSPTQEPIQCLHTLHLSVRRKDETERRQEKAPRLTPSCRSCCWNVFNVDSNEKKGSCWRSRTAGEEHIKGSQFRCRHQIEWKVFVFSWFYVRPRRVPFMSVFHLPSGGRGGAGAFVLPSGDPDADFSIDVGEPVAIAHSPASRRITA